MSQFFIHVSTLVLCGIALAAFYVALDAFFSKSLDRTRQAIESQPGRSFLIGLVNAIFFGAIGVGFLILTRQWTSFFLLPALAFLAPLTIGATFGIGAMISLAGDRLFPGQGPQQRRILATLVLYVACLTPIIGWVLMTGYLAATGLGGLILGFFRRKKATDPGALPEETPEKED